MPDLEEACIAAQAVAPTPVRAGGLTLDRAADFTQGPAAELTRDPAADYTQAQGADSIPAQVEVFTLVQEVGCIRGLTRGRI